MSKTFDRTFYMEQDYTHYLWYKKLGLYETLLIIFDDGSSRRDEYFKQQGVKNEE